MIYTISNEYIQVSIKKLGAELCSLKKLDDTLEYIWQADEKYWARHSPILFPIVGKLLDNEYIYENKTYKISQHGFARDCIFELVKKEDDSIVFKLQSNEDTLNIYPFEFELYVEYRIEKNTLDIIWKVLNKSKGEMLFSIGAHPAFNWPLKSGDKSEYFMEFEDTKELQRLPLTSKGINADYELVELENSNLSLDEELFKDDALVIQNLENKSIVLKNSLDDSMVKVEFESFPYLGIWSKPTGAPFICIEPWYGVADFINHNKELKDKKGIISLEKDGIFQSKYSISI